MERWVLVEGAVDVVGAFEGVEVAGAEGFFAAGPADKVFCCWAGEGFYFSLACYGIIVDRWGKRWWLPSSSAGRAARYDALEST